MNLFIKVSVHFISQLVVTYISKVGDYNLQWYRLVDPLMKHFVDRMERHQQNLATQKDNIIIETLKV